MNGITGAGHQRCILGAQIGVQKVRQAFLGPDKGQDLGVRVQVHAEAAVVP